MGRYEKRIWQADLAAYGGRKSRRSFSYRAFVPDSIAELEVELPGDVAEVVVEADRAVVELDRKAAGSDGFEALARQLLRAESIASSRIEGLEISQRRLAEALAGSGRYDPIAEEVTGNIAAMERAIALGAGASTIGVEDLCALHHALLQGTVHKRIAGQVRESQNWIGASYSTPANADFVPPPPEYVPELLKDLCGFIAREDMPAIVQAAIAHAQFETIHPFADGNGRVGRCLIHVVLRRRGLADRYVPPISLVLAADVRAYIGGLTAYREGELAEWCATFAAATRTAARKAELFSRQVAVLQDHWRARAGRPRPDSTVEKTIAALPGHPVVDVKAVMRIAGCSEMAAGRAVRALDQAGVLTQIGEGRRNRIWEALDLFELANSFERELAIPPGARHPARPVPRP